jgi:uncharacterized protein YjbJ (UPF0337 family)
MDKDRVEGTMKDVKGRVKRQVGEWTDDSKLQGEGLVDQAKGKIQNTFGKGKDSVRDAADDVRDEADRNDRDVADDFDKKRSA